MSTNRSPDASPLTRLSTLLTRLPGIGEKSALRLALWLARADAEYVGALAQALRDVHETMRLCSVCCDLCAGELCERCADARRDHSLVCVVAHPQDRIAFERAGVFRGLYHVLHGVLDPLAGVGPAELKVDALLARLQGDEVEEVIVATSPNVEGDATALYLSKLLRPLGVRVSRIASGVAVGGELEYADMSTLHRALADRRAL
ncbi:MAG: recombination mediator RecR [Nannocystaceae bacterium]|nr:recombination protein RecR [Myxococcales bacterium]